MKVHKAPVQVAMNDDAAFLEAMQQHPEDNALRLVFANWLEERGDKRVS